MRTDRQTDRYTDALLAILGIPTWDEAINAKLYLIERHKPAK